MSRRSAAAAIQRHGGVLDEDTPDLLVLGESASESERLEAAELAEALRCELTPESELWRRLGLIDEAEGVNRLYSPAMLADLVGAPLALVRRWVRRGYLRPVCSVQRLDYFDFAEACVAKLLVELTRCRLSAAAVDREVDRLIAAHPGIDRPLAQLPVVVADGCLLVRDRAALQEPTGQTRFDFEDLEDGHDTSSGVLRLAVPEERVQPEGLRERAWGYADDGRIGDAVATWRLAMLESAPTAEDHATLADWLYALGDLAGARERYYAALELDAELLPARLSLGCVLVDLGDLGLAEASFRGVLALHGGSPDAHFHLAGLLERRGDAEGAAPHWRRLLEVAPESPWADEARTRLAPEA